VKAGAGLRRIVIALEQSLFDGAERASYANEAEVSLATASSDFRRLVDGGLVIQRGEPVAHDTWRRSPF